MMFSIVTPSYNQLRWLKLCISSVADQQNVRFEHIIQDAKSGPDLENWVRTHSNAKLIVESDSGMYDAINRGFLKATGDIVAWLNCDEQYLPGTLAKVADYFTRNPKVDVLFGDAVLLSEEGSLLSYRRTILPSLIHTQLSHLNTLSCATFVRRSVIERGFLLKPEWKAIADAVWVADMIKARLKMAVLPEALSAFTLTAANLGQSSLAYKEGERWKIQATQPWQRILKPAVVAWHRVRKFCHGAYALRSFSTEIYTEATGYEKRAAVSAGNLSFTWSRSPDHIGPSRLIWKWIRNLSRVLFTHHSHPAPQKALPFGFYTPPHWPLACHIILPFALAAVIFYFEQISGPAIIIAPMFSMVLMLILSFFLEPLQLIPFAITFTAVIYWSVHYMQSFDESNPTDWFRLGLRIGGFITASTLAILFSKSRREAKIQQEQALQVMTNLPTPVIISDPLGIILFANEQALEFTGLSKGELIGSFYPRRFMPDQDEGSAMRDYIQFFHSAPQTGVPAIPRRRDISLVQGANHANKVDAHIICLGEGESRYMVTVFKA